MKVTVGIIVRNEAGRIAETLAGLLDLEFDRSEFEIVVVDGNSTDGTPDIVRSFIEHHREVAIRLIPETGKPSHGNARNLVLEHARGEFVAFTDADCVIPPDWLTRLVAVLERERGQDEKVVAAGGIRYPVETANWKEKVLNAMFATYLGSGGSGGFVMGRSKFTDSVGNYNAIYVRGTALSEKYLSIGFGEDFEFNRRLVRKGYRIVLSPEPKVFHHQDPSFRAFVKQMFRYGRGQAEVWRLAGEVRRFAPLAALFLVCVLFGWLSYFVSTILFVAYLAVIGSYLTAVIATAVYLAIKWRDVRVLSAVLLFPLQHGVYALGFLAGLLRPVKE